MPAAINRGAYYLTNFDELLEPAKQGVLPTPFPGNFVLPMVSPIDLAKAAVARLTSPVDDAGIRFIEGPKRYSFEEVAKAFSGVLNRDVAVQQIPRDEIEASFRKLGFSEPSARAFARMTKLTLNGPEMPDDFTRGHVTLEDHIASLVAQRA